VISRLLAPGGLLISTVPAGPMSKFDKFIGHKRHYSQRSFKSTLSEGGFEKIHIQRAGFPAINITRLFTIIMGTRMVRMLSNPHFGKGELFSRMVLILRVLFNFAVNDSPLGWQLISTAKVSDANKISNVPIK